MLPCISVIHLKQIQRESVLTCIYITDQMACPCCLLADGNLRFNLFAASTQIDTLAEWSKALDLGSSSRERGFKSHRCQHFCLVSGI